VIIEMKIILLCTCMLDLRSSLSVHPNKLMVDDLKFGLCTLRGGGYDAE
jgi:hypothetical protein